MSLCKLDSPKRRAAVVLLLISMLGACASAPVQEMSDARQAVAAAREAGAAQRTPNELKAAERSLQQAQAELQQYQYREARQRALLAKSQAVEARQRALAQQRHEQAQRANTAIDAAGRAIQKVTALRGDAQPALVLLKKAQAAAQIGEYTQAREQARAAEQQAKVSLNQAYLDIARKRIAHARTHRYHLSRQQRRTLPQAEAAVRRKDGKLAYELTQNW